MTDIEQTLAEIRRRDNMYSTSELTAGAVADRRALLHIIDQLHDVEQAVAQLDAINYDEVEFPGPRAMHEAADDILLATVPAEVAAAYQRLIDRCGWWAFA